MKRRTNKGLCHLINTNELIDAVKNKLDLSARILERRVQMNARNVFSARFMLDPKVNVYGHKRTHPQDERAMFMHNGTPWPWPPFGLGQGRAVMHKHRAFNLRIRTLSVDPFVDRA